MGMPSPGKSAKKRTSPTLLRGKSRTGGSLLRSKPRRPPKPKAKASGKHRIRLKRLKRPAGKRPLRRVRPLPLVRKRRNSPPPRTILVLDHFVPHFDKDTGSRNMFQYLNLFRDMGLAVKFAGYDFTRYEPYTSMLEERGIEVLSGEPEAMRKWLKRHGSKVAYAYINRPHVGETYLDMVRDHTKAKIIYNSVDFGFLREERRAAVEGNPLALSHAQELKAREFALFHKSDVVYTVSEFERVLLEGLLPGKRVADIPTFVYEPPFPKGEPVPYEERSFITFVGGYNHSPNVDGVLWFVGEIWPMIRTQLPEATLVVIGSNAPPPITELHGKDGICMPGSVSDDELEWFYSRTKAVIAPLRYGAGVKGKVIEAVARGVPVVTTSVGAEGIREWGDIIIADDSNEGFAAQVVDLFRNADRWHWIRDRQTDYAYRYLTTDYAKQVVSTDIIPNPNHGRR